MATTVSSHPKDWVDGPCKMVHTPMYESKKDDIFSKGASHMALLHNAVFRGYNSIYHQAERVKPEDYSDFIGYCLAWAKFVKGHHDDEEANLFPKVEEVVGQKGIWDETLKEHESFVKGLTDFHDYLSSVSATPASFSGTQLLHIMATFQEPFDTHFHNEVGLIASFTRFGDFPAAGPIFANWGKNSIMKAGMTDVVPFLFLNFDRTFEDGMWSQWPPMPRTIRWMLSWGGSSVHWGWWKFASCDAWGSPKELYATPKQQDAKN